MRKFKILCMLIRPNKLRNSIDFQAIWRVKALTSEIMNWVGQAVKKKTTTKELGRYVQ